MKRAVISALVVCLLPSVGAAASTHPGAAEFAAMMAREHGFEQARVAALLAQAVKQEDILKAMARPAESLPWYRYRPIFLTPSRIGEGVEFWNAHRESLARAEAQYGVDQAVIVAILGVETRYGEITGGHRVLDALATLAFYYPPRAAFFRDELEQFLLLARDEDIPLDQVEGSYAGAMGLGQFISSSYRAYAVDFDGDGQRNLWEIPDAIGSVANYFHQHGWKPDAPVAVKAKAAPSARPLPDATLKPQWNLAEITQRGFAPSAPLDAGAKVTLIALQQPGGPEYWLGLHNFYVISRYNHSPLYAMAVHQLSQAIRAAREYTAGP